MSGSGDPAARYFDPDPSESEADDYDQAGNVDPEQAANDQPDRGVNDQELDPNVEFNGEIEDDDDLDAEFEGEIGGGDDFVETPGASLEGAEDAANRMAQSQAAQKSRRTDQPSQAATVSSERQRLLAARHANIVRFRKRMVIVAVIVVVLLAVAAILIGVLVGRDRSGRSSSSSLDNGGVPATPSPTSMPVVISLAPLTPAPTTRPPTKSPILPTASPIEAPAPTPLPSRTPTAAPNAAASIAVARPSPAPVLATPDPSTTVASVIPSVAPSYLPPSGTTSTLIPSIGPSMVAGAPSTAIPSTQNPAPAASGAPVVDSQRATAVRERITSDFITTSSTQEQIACYQQAMDWILDQDELQLDETASNLVQRFAAAYFYCETTLNVPWVACNPPTDGETNDCIHLRLVSISPDQYVEIPWIRWLTNTSECEWAGISCNSAREISIVELNAYSLNGQFPEALANWPSLEQFLGLQNSLYGPLLEGLALPNILELALGGNSFSGSIPGSWWQLTSLEQLILFGNNLSGFLDAQLSQLANLQTLMLNDNQLYGSIPPELSALNNLRSLRLSFNLFDGAFPTVTASAATLQEIWVDSNFFTGTLPGDIGQYTSLTSLRTGLNDIAGALPDGLWELTALEDLSLGGCQFTGTIDTKIGTLSDLAYLRLQQNRFSGILPTEVGLLTNLLVMDVSSNMITGTMPADVCALRGNPGLQELVADCLPDSSGVTELQCDCCSSCF